MCVVCVLYVCICDVLLYVCVYVVCVLYVCICDVRAVCVCVYVVCVLYVCVCVCCKCVYVVCVFLSFLRHGFPVYSSLQP